MALRELLTRHRIGPAVAAPVVLGLAAAVAATWALTSPPQTAETQLKASVTECHDMVTISVAGRNDTPVEGTTKMLVDANGNPLPAALSGDHRSHWVDPVVNAPADDVEPGSYAAVYIAYPANMATYEDAVNSGVANTEQVMREIAQACPDTKFSIVGYSEGADVVRRVAMKIGHQEPGQDGAYGIVDPDDVVGVVILADAGRSAGDGPFPGAEDPFRNPDGFDQEYQNGKTPVPGQGALPGTSGDFGALNGKIASFCSDGDLTCAAPENISLLQLVVNVGRQLNVDALEREGLTPATGQDVAVVLSRIALAAFADIQSQPNWMQSDETFLEVLLRVSDPAYKPGETPAEPTEPGEADAISTDEMAPLAYLPQKVLNEIIGLILTNQNTIPVIMSDPYNLTLGPNGTGHHFDYWRDADAGNGKPLTSAEYAAAWLTHLAKQAQAGKQVDTAAKPEPADLAAAYEAATTSATPTSEPVAEPTSSPTTTSSEPNTPEQTTSPTVAATPKTTTPPAPTTTETPSRTTQPAPTTTETLSRTTQPAPTTTESTTTGTSSETTIPTPAPTSGVSVAAPN
ncbi:cutinase family protein [Nocardia donostiensis]|uniref:Cutinase n=1 Tax=Nocardia donostiensis TaxID=1538463 RepID=A0A1V2TLE1_9NOCA|nr:cutinase family protein [Nocardia donostiensis]ONM50312.1 cutinase [Nocardia donostiensis]OQS19450.1 cutinase [Nocardia donostiensis]